MKASYETVSTDIEPAHETMALLTQATSGPGEPAQPRSPYRAPAARTHKARKETKGPTKNQTPSPTGRPRKRARGSKCSDVMCHIFFEGYAYPKSEINIVDQCWPEVRPESSLFMFVKWWLWWKFILFRPGYMPVNFELSILLRFPHWKLYFYR